MSQTASNAAAELAARLLREDSDIAAAFRSINEVMHRAGYALVCQKVQNWVNVSYLGQLIAGLSISDLTEARELFHVCQEHIGEGAELCQVQAWAAVAVIIAIRAQRKEGSS